MIYMRAQMFRFLKSSLGKKYIMALTGIALIGFVIMHLLGNLQIFLGPEALNSYSQTLRGMGPLLWAARIGLVAVFVIHIFTGIKLAIENRRARPEPYLKEDTIRATRTSRTMVLSGLLILAYVIYHLLHFTLHVTDPAYAGMTDTHGRLDVYRMVVAGFSRPAVAGAYIAAMLILGAHLYHGASSFFQSMGWNGPKYERFVRWFGPVLGTVIAGGYIIIPLAVWVGWLK